jgi:hypothetical protein
MELFRMLVFRLGTLSIGILFTFNYMQSQNYPRIYGDNIQASIKEISESYDKGFYLTAFTYTYQGVNQYGWIIKIDINGNILWDKKFGNGNDRNWFGDSFLTSDDGLIISGITTKYSGGDFDPAFFKMNVCGEIEWCKVFQSPDQNYGTGILQLADGSYIGMLEYYGEGETYARISLVKMDQSGEPLWIQRLAQEDSIINNEEGLYLYSTTDNDYLVSGYAYHPDSYPFWIMIDTNGVQIWDLFGDNFLGEAHQVLEKDSGIFYSTSYAIGDNGIQSPVLFKFNKNSDLLGEYNLMGDTIVMGSSTPIASLDDSTLIIGVGWKKIYYPIGHGFAEVFITDTLGNLINRRQFFDDEYNSFKKITLSSDHKILAAGNFVVDGNWDIYLWKMNADLEDDTLYTQPITYDSLCPYEIISDTVDLDCSLFVNIDEIPTKEVYESTIKISPNPARDWIVLTFPDIWKSEETELIIYNIFGQGVMKTKPAPQNRTVSLNISSLPSGVYLVTCRDSKQRGLTGKFVISR